MKVLKFIVNEQSLVRDPTCDFSGIVSGTKGYLEAQFKFNSTWTGFGKVAIFTNLLEDYPAILKGDRCLIPADALTGSEFSISVVGSSNGKRLTTNSVSVEQERR